MHPVDNGCFSTSTDLRIFRPVMTWVFPWSLVSTSAPLSTPAWGPCPIRPDMGSQSETWTPPLALSASAPSDAMPLTTFLSWAREWLFHLLCHGLSLNIVLFNIQCKGKLCEEVHIRRSALGPVHMSGSYPRARGAGGVEGKARVERKSPEKRVAFFEPRSPLET